MSVAELEEELSKARTAYRADKSDKKLKKAFKKAKKALAAAKEAAEKAAAEKAAAEKAAAEKAAAEKEAAEKAAKKRPAEDEIEKPKKKAKTGPSLEDLKQAAKEAKKAWKANKDDKSLKKVWKKAKKAVEEYKEESSESSESSESEEEEEEEEVVDIDALKAAVKTAKKEYRKDKSNKEAKAAFKAAKAALAEAEAKVADKNGEEETKEETKEDAMDTKDDGATDVLAGLKKSEPAPAPAPASDFLSGLKSRGSGPGRGKLGGRPNDSANPPGTRCFLGNLSYDIDDEKIKDFFKDYGTLQDIFWMTDRETGEFRGCGIIEFETVELATKAIADKAEEDLMGRALKINFARPKPGGGGRGGGRGRNRPLSERHPDCTTVFIGNLSEDIDDAKITEFFGDCGGISQVRWLTDRDTGEFKRAGFVEFTDPSVGLDIAIKKNGQDLMGKSIRIDYAKPRERKY